MNSSIHTSSVPISEVLSDIKLLSIDRERFLQFGGLN
jgi:hypothetical protein